MNKKSRIFLLGCLFFSVVNIVLAGEQFSTVDYLGHRIALARAYSDFDEYKNDPKNLPAQSARRAEVLMRNARFGPEFVNDAELSSELERLQFPGYGSFYANQLGARLDPTLELVYLEIPGRALNRYFAVEKAKNGSMRVVADFVAAAQPEITRVHLKKGALSFESSKGEAIAVMPYLRQESSCPKELTWTDAIYAQSATRVNGQLVKVKVEAFSNAVADEIIDENGNRGAMISLRGKGDAAGDDAITLTFGKNRPKPIDFGEIGMAVAPPMAEGKWPRMKRPCDVKDGSVVEFSENDLEPDVAENAPNIPPVHGVLKRQGLNFSYSVKIEAEGTQPAFSAEGKLKYGEISKVFDLATDVQGWNLYRGNTFVKTLPVGKKLPLSAVLNEMNKRPQ